MNISKLKLVWKYLTGGKSAVLDYVLDVANSFVAKLDGAKQSEIKEYLTMARQVLSTLIDCEWLCPKKWRNEYAQTLAAFGDLVDALGDLELTPEEIAKVSQSFQLAYAAWRAE